MKNVGFVIVQNLHSIPPPPFLLVVMWFLLIKAMCCWLATTVHRLQSEVYVCVLQHVNSFAGPDTAEHSSWRVEPGNCGLRCRRVRNIAHIQYRKEKKITWRICHIVGCRMWYSRYFCHLTAQGLLGSGYYLCVSFTCLCGFPLNTPVSSHLPGELQHYIAPRCDPTSHPVFPGLELCPLIRINQSLNMNTDEMLYCFN